MAQRSTGHILAGNHRYLAAVEEGADQVPVVWVDVDDARARKILLTDNRTADLATYDNPALVEMLRRLEDLSGTGYGSDDVEEIIRALETPTDDEWAQALVPFDDRGVKTAHTVSFVLTPPQIATLRRALDAVESNGEGSTQERRAAALIEICTTYLGVMA